MRNWWFICLLLVMASCCGRPDGVMSQREMRSFLTDLPLLEGVLLQNTATSSDERVEVY